MRVVTISAFFPEMKAAAIYRTSRGEGSTVRAAGARAFAALLKMQKAKRYTTFKAEVNIGTVPDTAKETHGGANEDQAEGHFPQSKS